MTEYIALVKWSDGYTALSDGGTGEVVTVYADHGSVSDRGAATGIAQSILDNLVGPRQTTTVDVVPNPVAMTVDLLAADGSTLQSGLQVTGGFCFEEENGEGSWQVTLPDLASGASSATLGRLVRFTSASTLPFDVADTLTHPTRSGTASARVRSRRVDLDANGFARVAPSLTDPAELLEERTQLAIKRTSGGTLGGRSAGATPTERMGLGIPAGAVRQPTIPPFSFSGAAIVANAVTPVWTAEQACVIPKIQLTCWVTHPGQLVVRLIRAGSSVREMVLPSSTNARSFLCTNLVVTPGQQLWAEVVSVASGPVDDNVRLTVQPLAGVATLVNDADRREF